MFCITFRSTSLNCADAPAGVIKIMPDRIPAATKWRGVRKVNRRAFSLSAPGTCNWRTFSMTPPARPDARNRCKRHDKGNSSKIIQPAVATTAAARAQSKRVKG